MCTEPIYSVVIVLSVGEIKEEKFLEGKEACKHLEEEEIYFIPLNFYIYKTVEMEDLNVYEIVQFIVDN